MGFGSIVIWGILIISVLQTGLNFYVTFHAPRCPESSSDCYGPLFTPGEPVDVYVFLTTKRKLRWWTEAGLEQLRLAPFWNATALPFGDVHSPNETVTVPLSEPSLAAVRRNESALIAHSFLLRSGTRLEDAIGAVSRSPDPGPEGGALGEHGVHAAGLLTKVLPYTPRAERRSLLSGGGAEEDPEAPVSRMPVTIDGVPYFGSLSLYPNEALMWVGAAWSLGAFFQPSLPVATVRLLLTVILPYLYTLQQTQEAQYRAALRLRARAEHERLLAEGTVLLPHLVYQVRLELGVEAERYDGRFRPPLLYKEMVYEGRGAMPVGERDIRYKVVGKQKRYVPPFAVETFGLRTRFWSHIDSNASRPDPKVPVILDVTGMQRYSVVQMLRQSLNMYLRVGAREADLEDLQDFLFRYPLHIMIIMQVIGVLQTVLTTLAFKNDISFFRGRADYTGLSSRSLATDTLQELIIFLYLYDYENIGRLVLFQLGTSVLIGTWKYARVARLRLAWSYCLPWVRSARSDVKGDQEAATEEMDARGMRYLKFVLYPLSAVWGLYNLYHYQYKSWWSWMISSMADFAYTFGFINMMPQIFINYKLKSVAHMPWRVLMYKFFHTFIDDVFAFFIMSDYMTKKHRWMTLRDDVVFFIFLYQRYKYQVDPTRPDEFGFVYADAPPPQVADAVPASQAPGGSPAPAALEQAPAPEAAAKAAAKAAPSGGAGEAAVETAVPVEVLSKATAAEETGAAGKARRRRKGKGQDGQADDPDHSLDKGKEDPGIADRPASEE